MKRLYTVLASIFVSVAASAQITITAADMPVATDTLRYSNAAPGVTTISPGDSGANFNWNYALTPVSQGVDTFQTAVSVNPLYALTLGLSAFGYKLSDSLPAIGGALPISVSDIYTFFEEPSSPSRFEAYAVGAQISGFPLAFTYTSPDVWYFFPLTYMSADSSPISLTIALDTIATIKQKGYRLTRCDGWGTITTPYYTSPINCIRLRSQVFATDSITYGGTTFGIPANTVEYKWLANGQHFPALWVTSNVLGGTEVVTSIQYRDSFRNIDTSTVIDNAAPNVTKVAPAVKVFPNPSASGLFTLSIPSGWNFWIVEVYNLKGELAKVVQNQKDLNLSELPAGNYLLRVVSGSSASFVPITK